MRVQAWHIIVLVVVLILLFGAKRLPDAARSLGRSMRIIKAETRDLLDDEVKSRGESIPGRQQVAPHDTKATTIESSEIINPERITNDRQNLGGWVR
jgi:sec-independent protein translocase protein TatA